MNYWLGQGAQATERVQKLHKLNDGKVEMRDQPKKSTPGKKRAEKEAAEAEAAAEAAKPPPQKQKAASCRR